MKKRIVVVDDEPLIIILMKEVIEEDHEFEVAQMASGKNEFLNLMDQHSFDAAIIDISVGCREGGIELLHILTNKKIELPLIILSAHDELLYALKCLQAGAKGYVNKKYICTDVVKCLKEVLAGHLFVSGDKGDFILNDFKKLNAPASMQS